MPDGTVYNKESFLALYENDTKTYTSAANTAFNVRVYGKNFAVTTGDDQYIGKDKDGKAFRHKGRFTNVWVRKSGTWQVVAGHPSKIE
jgi:ketosteroid isomerase-like protein